MTAPVSAERWLAIRALREGESPTFERLAAVSGLHPVTIRQRALTDSWEKQHFPRAGSRAARKPVGQTDEKAVAEAALLSPDELRQRLAATLPRQLARIVAQAESGKADREQVDMVLATTRVLERLGPLFEDYDTEQKNRSDDELAGLLEKIDDRIVELAEEHARRLVEEGGRGEMG